MSRYISDRVSARRQSVGRAIREVVAVVQDLLKLVEAAEPRFVSTLVESTCAPSSGSPGGGPGNSGAGTGAVGGGGGGGVRYEGLRVLSPTDFLVCLYLNQMGVFNFADDSSLPGCAVLKLSDGRKRSMSLWCDHHSIFTIIISQTEYSRSIAINELIQGGVHNRLRLPLRAEDPGAIRFAGGAGGGEVSVSRRAPRHPGPQQRVLLRGPSPRS